MSLTELTIAELHEKLAAREVSSVEVTKAYLERISKLDKNINSYVRVTDETALKAAELADKRLADGDNVTPLTGVPIGLKDIFITEGIETTCASKILGGFIPPYEGTPSRKLLEAGAVTLGKLNMDEFAMGSSNETSHFGPVKNRDSIARSTRRLSPFRLGANWRSPTGHRAVPTSTRRV